MSDLHDKSLILATDLDGTFLGGARRHRRRLHAWIEDNRSRLGLVFVTGRAAGFVDEITATGVPRPDYVIAELGGVIARMGGDRLAPLAKLALPMPRDWPALRQQAQTYLDALPGLTRDPQGSAANLSYHVDRSRFDRAGLAGIARPGLSVILSAGRHLDVQPEGHGKGPALAALLDHLAIGAGPVVVAGDSLNDLSMLAGGWNGIAVGGAEPGLIDALRGRPGIHLARITGAGGILEGLAARGIGPGLPADPTTGKD